MSGEHQTSRARQTEALRRAMGPEILTPLDDPKVVEIMLNPDGTLWVDRLGEGMRQTGRSTPCGRLPSSTPWRPCSIPW
ncbi:hypothetical protein THICB1_120103 [Thiomonas arsenitoxydans]|uniref:P-type conjugative transfer ATPase TrbB n=1 Tax=Thiomonas arsenitoxydans (strain DSM 22701 / CIP 110005 / 3As) TaxID=426114 RepID=A0ABM9T3C3_THIA3|nr:hypothetical protein THICB1_120103 [Thiomonas arsenitoxydans]CQR34877.1 hypothetical protein THICB6_200042 [Thiomonas arsenitoxydans]CQR35950.1 hypothetical protein ACO7_470053 [Thiomonas arsenitoxydans]CQR36043.1 hypothetical protein ACO3_470053 [Thiomonas arsenitoxydans]